MKDLFDKCRRFTTARELQAAGVYPFFHRVDSGQNPEVVIEGRRMVMVGSNNYLGLASDRRVKSAAIAATLKYGAGCVGSRFLNGTLPIHEDLEARLARFVGKEAAIVFATGMQTNLGAISALAGKDDVIICDKYNHASILDGCRLSFAKMLRFRHNDMADLERTLQAAGDAGKLIIVDGVFSMEGDIADLPNIVRLSKKFGARLLVDDAHGIGVLGKRGRGTAEHFGLTDEVDLIMGTFSKSLASIGGFIAGSEEAIHFIKHHARSFIFSAALSPGCVGTVQAALDIVEREPERLSRLWANTRKMRDGFRKMGYDTGTSETPIVPIVVGDDLTALQMWRTFFDRGIFTTPAIAPASPPGRALIRTSYMATHTDEILDYVLETFEAVGRELALIGPHAKAREARSVGEGLQALHAAATAGHNGNGDRVRSYDGAVVGAPSWSPAPPHPRWGQPVVTRRIRQGYEKTVRTVRVVGTRWAKQSARAMRATRGFASRDFASRRGRPSGRPAVDTTDSAVTRERMRAWMRDLWGRFRS